MMMMEAIPDITFTITIFVLLLYFLILLLFHSNSKVLLSTGWGAP